MYIHKVEHTKQYSDNQGEYIVTPAKLIFTDTKISIKNIPKFFEDDILENVRSLKPILISETEGIEMGDWVYNSDLKTIGRATQLDFNGKYNFKVLAFPEHFSDKHLQTIADGKMKEECKILVRCEAYNKYNEPDVSFSRLPKRIYLDQQNHITLFPAKQSLEKFIDQYMEQFPVNTKTGGLAFDISDMITAMKATAKWAKKNNYE